MGGVHHDNQAPILFAAPVLSETRYVLSFDNDDKEYRVLLPFIMARTGQ